MNMFTPKIKNSPLKYFLKSNNPFTEVRFLLRKMVNFYIFSLVEILVTRNDCFS